MISMGFKYLSLFQLTLFLGLHAAHSQSGTGSFETAEKRKVVYETLSNKPQKGTLILLHGASGPGMELYQQQARYFADHGFYVVVPHYFDATSTPMPSDQNYILWQQSIESLIAKLSQSESTGKIFLVGYSLGASVALSVASQDQSIAAVSEWYGSLPDTFSYRLRGMAPLLILHGERDTNIPVANARQLMRLCELQHFRCDSHLYSDQHHGFDTITVRDADERTTAFFDKAVIDK